MGLREEFAMGLGAGLEFSGKDALPLLVLVEKYGLLRDSLVPVAHRLPANVEFGLDVVDLALEEPDGRGWLLAFRATRGRHDAVLFHDVEFPGWFLA